jgi:hypothetical protein
MALNIASWIEELLHNLNIAGWTEEVWKTLNEEH